VNAEMAGLGSGIESHSIPAADRSALVVYGPTTTTAGAGDHLDAPNLAHRFKA
jgi:hypothetical protein